MDSVADRLAALCDLADATDREDSDLAWAQVGNILGDPAVRDAIVAVLRPRAGRCRECGSRKSTPWVQVEPCDTDCTIGALARAIDAAMKETT